MIQTDQYTVEVPAEFVFDWLVQGTFFLASMNLQSFQFDVLETGGRFIAYEEINDHRFVPVKGEYLKYERPSHFQLQMWFPGGIQKIAYQLEAIDQSTRVHITVDKKYYSLFFRLGSRLFQKRRAQSFHLALQQEKQNLEEAFQDNRLNTRISGLKIDRYDMDEKWKIHYPNNPYLSWVRPNV